MKYQCAKCETIFEHEKYLTECDGEKTCPICDTMDVVYKLSNRFEQQVIPKIAENWTHKLGDEVVREIDIYNPARGVKRGIVVECYSQKYPSGRYYPELYAVQWEDKIERGFLAHGIR